MLSFEEAGVESASSAVAEACKGEGESGRDCAPKEADVVGVKADTVLIMTAAATPKILSDRTIFGVD